VVAIVVSFPVGVHSNGLCPFNPTGTSAASLHSVACRKHLGYKAEHVVDLESEYLLGATMYEPGFSIWVEPGTDPDSKPSRL
jgi:hypothetical protein